MVDVGGANFAYRQLGASNGVPVIFLNHLGAVLDNWDPRVIDGVAARHRVITFDNRGVGASEGSTPDSVEAMARDAVAFIRALGFEQVDLVGFSLGGMVSQVIAQEEPQLVRSIVLAGTGPAGGVGIDCVRFVSARWCPIWQQLPARAPGRWVECITRRDHPQPLPHHYVDDVGEADVAHPPSEPPAAGTREADRTHVRRVVGAREGARIHAEYAERVLTRASAVVDLDHLAGDRGRMSLAR